MTANQLIDEGRRLQRPCTFLRPEPNGPVAGIWHNATRESIESERWCVTVDASQIPGYETSSIKSMKLKSDQVKLQTSSIQNELPLSQRKDTKLYGFPADVLPPLEAVFLLGSETVGEWLAENGWDRTERYNDNFKSKDIVLPYLELWRSEFPLYFQNDIYAILGGWHWPGPDSDWYELAGEQLMILTLHDAEPWIEAWRLRDGKCKVIERIT